MVRFAQSVMENKMSLCYCFLNLPKEILFMDGSYIHYTYDAEDLTQFFTDINITEENGIPYLNVMYKGKKPICERILKLDAERYQKGDLPLSNLLSKYCSYIVAGNRE